MSDTLPTTLLALALMVAPLARAHDPALHAEEAAEAKKGPECVKLNHSKMAENDAVAQALMAKCGMSHKAQGAKGESVKPADGGAKPDPATPASHAGQQP
jgi:hypothetical protein